MERHCGAGDDFAVMVVPLMNGVSTFPRGSISSNVNAGYVETLETGVFAVVSFHGKLPLPVKVANSEVPPSVPINPLNPVVPIFMSRAEAKGRDVKLAIANAVYPAGIFTNGFEKAASGPK